MKYMDLIALFFRTLSQFPEVKICIKYATEHRCGIVLSYPSRPDAFSDRITGTDPLKDKYYIMITSGEILFSIVYHFLIVFRWLVKGSHRNLFIHVAWLMLYLWRFKGY